MKKESVIIHTQNEEVSRLVAEMFERAAALLTFTGEFVSQIAEFDQTKPEFEMREDFAPAMERYLASVCLVYPTPQLLQSDIQNFERFRKVNIGNAVNKGH